ncbi:MAG: aromatic amino acid lyase, partial [Candidatus Neomarinimicrobiota bacterium]|nr:aromatic amino acid lyase [Candidatus Neomarinimicrobiota bacterium]
MEAQIISDKFITWHELEHLIVSPNPVRLSQASKKLINSSNNTLSEILKSGKKIYGVNTGFGKLSSVSIDKKDIKELQLNLVRSHATGVGKP